MVSGRTQTDTPKTAKAVAGLWLLALAAGCGSGIHTPVETSGTAVAAARGPQLGYFWNAADQTLRPVLGVAGASQVGASVVPAGTYQNGAGSAASNMGVLQEPDGSLDVMALPAGAPVHVAAATSTGSSVHFSPSGKAAVVFAAGKTSLAVLTSLDGAASLTTLTAATPVTDAAVSDDGHVVFATAGASGLALEAISVAGVGRTIAQVGALGGLSFAGGDDLVFADSASNQLVLVHNEATTAAATQVPTASLLKGAVALAVSPGGQWLAVTNSGEASVVRVDLSGQTAPLLIPCACTPTSAVALSGAGRFRITEPGAGPLWAVETVSSTPRTFFIPALPQGRK